MFRHKNPDCKFEIMLHRFTLGLTEASIEMGSKIKFHKKIFHKMRNIYVIIVTKASLIHNWHKEEGPMKNLQLLNHMS